MACCISVIRGPKTELSSLRYEFRPRIRLTMIRMRTRTQSATRRNEPTRPGRNSRRREKNGKKSAARRQSEIYAMRRPRTIRIFIIPGPRISHTPADIRVICRSLPGDSFMRSRNSVLRDPGRTVSIQAGNTHAMSKAGTCRWLRRNPVLISMRRSISRRSGCFASLAGVAGWSAPGYQRGFLVPRQ